MGREGHFHCEARDSSICSGIRTSVDVIQSRGSFLTGATISMARSLVPESSATEHNEGKATGQATGQASGFSELLGELSHNLMFQCSRVKYHFCIISKCLDVQHVAALLSAFMRHRCHQIQGETRGAKVRSGAVHVAALCGCEHSGFSESAGKPLSNAGALAKLNMFEHV